MRRGTLGDSESDESTLNFDRTRRPLQNRNTQPSTSRAAGKIVATARKSTSRQKNISNKPVGAARRKMTYRQRERKQIKEMVKLQMSTKLMIPKAPFSRLIREISLSFNSEITHYTITALEALQEATEIFLTQVLADAYLLTLHRKCVTLSRPDFLLIRALKLHF